MALRFATVGISVWEALCQGFSCLNFLLWYWAFQVGFFRLVNMLAQKKTCFWCSMTVVPFAWIKCKKPLQLRLRWNEWKTGPDVCCLWGYMSFKQFQLRCLNESLQAFGVAQAVTWRMHSHIFSFTFKLPTGLLLLRCLNYANTYTFLVMLACSLFKYRI